MGNSMNNSSKMAKNMAVVIAILVAVVFSCIFAATNSNRNKVAESTDQYGISSKMLRDNETVQTGRVIVNYLNAEGQAIIEATTKTGNVGEVYNVERAEINGYVRDGEEPLARAGVYSAEDITVNFYYKRAEKEVRSNIQHEGVNGATENQINLMFNNPHSARDYDLKIITKDENGTVLNGGVFAVSKDDTELRRGAVSNGSFYAGKIAIQESGKKTYQIEQISAKVGYQKLENPFDLGINSTWNSNNSQFEISLDQIRLAGVTATVNNDDSEIVVEVINPKYKDMYEMQIVNKSSGKVVNGGKFKVTKNNQLVKQGTVANGSLKVGEFEVSGSGSETYVVEEIEPAPGYERAIAEDTPGNAIVTTTYNDQTGAYSFEVGTNSIAGFSAEVSSDGVVTVYVESKEIDRYDLAIKKFVSEIDGVNTSSREPVVTVVNGKVQYAQNNDIEKAANEQKVTYTLRTYNESINKGNGKRIIEYIPAGLVFLPNNATNQEFGWNTYKLDKDGDLVATNVPSEATVVATTYMEDKEIAGFNAAEGELPNYEDVRVVFEIDEDKLPVKTERIIENRVKLDTNDKDPNPDNDETTEKIYVKYFDLAITKFIKEVTLTTDKGSETKQIGEDKKGQLVKLDVAKSQVKNASVRVTYGLRVRNVGEIAGYATEIADYVPEGFKLLEDGNWTLYDNKAISTKLDNTLLEPGDSTVLELTFDWKLTENNVGLKINEAEITKYENEYNAKDLTDDNKDNEGLLVAIKTGSLTLIIVAISIMAMSVIAVLIIKAKRKIEEENSAM